MFTVLSLVFLLGFLQGCIVATKNTAISTQITTMFKGQYTVDPYMEEHKPRTVAVIPFMDQSRSKRGTETVRKYFYNHFSSLPFKDMEIYRVDHLLRKAGLTDPAEISEKTPQELGKILNVDAVVFGTISNFDKMFAVVYSQVAVGAKIEMYDTETGHFLWRGEHTTRIQEGGISTTPVGIIATVIATSMNVRDIQLLRACDDLFRDMVKTIPVPTIAETSQPPVIMILTQDTQAKPKKAGDEIKVVMKGTPNMRAYFDIGEHRKGVDMKEVEPGGYFGVYRVVPGDNITGAVITGRLTDDTGNTAQWIDAVGTVTLDTIPPDAPVKAEVVSRDTFILLGWTKSRESDLAGYTVYRSMTPLSGFENIASLEFNQFRDEGLKNSITYFYKIAAYDAAGNESELTETLAGMPVAPGPTPVSGSLETDTIWYAGASPYVIEDTVTIKDKTLLTVEPGTIIQSKGGSLTVEGRIAATGDDTHLIRFEGYRGSDWKGIHFNNVRERKNILRFCRIKNATVGISCNASSPEIEDSEVTENAEGISIEGAFSRPPIRRNTVHKNTATGVVITDSAQPVIEQNKIHDNADGGIVVHNAEPKIVRNEIVRNRGAGIIVQVSQAEIAENAIVDNKPFNIVGRMTGNAIDARDNWWGTTDGLAVLAAVKGKIDVGSILTAAYPEGKPLILPILASELKGAVDADSYLTFSNSPYTVVNDLSVDNGSVLYIEPGVTIEFDQTTSIVTEDGGIVARGTMENPITFTASGASPSPGFYTSAVRFTGRGTKANSIFAHCVVQYATTAFDVQFGTPEISYCYIAHNAQSGIYCRNDASPKISFNTFAHNQGEGAIRCVGMSKPVIHNNNFMENSVAVQSFSSIYIDARHNWWGDDPPDKNLIWGVNINIEPWLKTPEESAFSRKEE